MTYCNYSNQEKYPFILPELPFDKNDFMPHFTSETFDYHHGKHHNAYVTNLNKLLENNNEYKNLDLEEVIAKSCTHNQSIFNNAAQIWNHSFFWNSIHPSKNHNPTGNILKQIEQDFGNYDKFTKEFKEAAISQFGSGWAWLVYSLSEGKLKIVKTANAETPITDGLHPIIACDVWEHAYYIDYRNKRPDYIDSFLNNMINWEFAEINLANIQK
ncbi:MAG: superoxide dismutase [Rickettsiaceae bacterium]|nr:superoxide dismutase [Rickettsiaceae bacterium]